MLFCAGAQRAWGAKRAAQHIPEFAKRLVAQYDRDGALTQRCAGSSRDVASASSTVGTANITAKSLALPRRAL